MSSRAVIARLKRIKGFVLDMDGTLVLGDRNNHGIHDLPGAAEFVDHLKQKGVPCVSFTNGTVRTSPDIAAKLDAVGIHFAPEQIFTPSSVAADYFTRKHFKRILVLGGEGVSKPLEEAGLEVVRPPVRDSIDAVYAGWHRDFTMADIEAACDAVWSGAKVYVASLVPFFATADGRTLGTSAAIAGAIRQITGARAKVLGKPSPEALKAASHALKLHAREIAVVGDDPILEIPMALRGGALAIGVTTGVAKEEDYLAVAKKDRAHLVVRDMEHLFSLYRD
jgi:HAD superfamily hydrolase (TIGR01450 family)